MSDLEQVFAAAEQPGQVGLAFELADSNLVTDVLDAEAQRRHYLVGAPSIQRAEAAFRARRQAGEWEAAVRQRPQLRTQTQALRDLSEQLAREYLTAGEAGAGDVLNRVPQHLQGDFLSEVLRLSESDEFRQIVPQRESFLTQAAERTYRGWSRIGENLRNMVGLWAGGALPEDQKEMQFRTIAETARRSFDPAAGRSLVGGGLLSAFENVPNLAISAVTQATPAGLPGVVAWWFGQTTPERYMEYRAAGAGNTASKVGAAATGLAEAAIETILSPLDVVIPRPLRQGATAAASRAVGQYLLRAGKEYGVAYLKEFSEEIFQDASRLATKAALDFLDANVQVDWRKEFGGAAENLPETAVAVAALMAPGAGGIALGALDVYDKDQVRRRFELISDAVKFAKSAPESARQWLEKMDAKPDGPSRADLPTLGRKEDRRTYLEVLRRSLPTIMSIQGSASPAGVTVVPEQLEAPRQTVMQELAAAGPPVEYAMAARFYHHQPERARQIAEAGQATRVAMRGIPGLSTLGARERFLRALQDIVRERPGEPPQEVPRAEEVREDKGQVQEARLEFQGSEAESGEDLHRPGGQPPEPGSFPPTPSSPPTPPQETPPRPGKPSSVAPGGTPTPPPLPVQPSASSPFRQVAERVRDLLRGGAHMNNAQIDQIARSVWGTAAGRARDVYDAAEGGLALYLAELGAELRGLDPQQALERLLDVTARMPRQSRRNEQQIELQQFSTPPAEGWVAVQAAAIRPDMTVLEPSAGTGLLAILARIQGGQVSTNEIDPRRREILQAVGFQPTGMDAEQLDNVMPPERRFDVVVMNPPFSATGGRVAGHDTKFGARHVYQALQRVKPGGRLVAIVGRGMAADRTSFRDWWLGVQKEYNVRANVGLEGKFYGKFGTGFDNQIIVIDNTGPTPDESRIITGASLSPLEAYTLLAPLVREDVRERVRRSETPSPPSDTGPVRTDAGPVPPAPTGGTGPRGRGRPVRPPGPVSAGRPGNVAVGTVGPGVPPPTPADASEGTDRPPERPGVATSVGGGIAPSSPSKPGPEGGRRPLTVEYEEGTPYAKYVVQKATVPEAQPHPADVVESAAMASVELPAPTAKHHLPLEVISEGRLSDLQIEFIIYANQIHEQFLPDGTRKAIFLGDGTGIGKGREIYGLIYSNFMRGRKKAVHFSVGPDLYPDADRDRTGVGCPLPLINQGAVGAKEAIEAEEGVLYTNYPLVAADFDKDGRRFRQIVDWLGPDFDGVIAFDECHRMKNATPQGFGGQGTKTAGGTNTGALGIELQRRFPKARVVYVSATGMTEARHMVPYERLGLWGPGAPFANFMGFIDAIKQGGVAAMEMLARDLKAIGQYLARTISYKGVEYEPLEHTMSPAEIANFNQVADLWRVLLEAYDAASENTGQRRRGGLEFQQFYNVQQRFFLQLMMAYEIEDVIRAAEKDLARGRSVVINLFKTGEAMTKRMVYEAKAEGILLDELEISPREMLVQMVERYFPVHQYVEVTDPITGQTRKMPAYQRPDGSVSTNSDHGPPLLNAQNLALQKRLLEQISNIELPGNPLDKLVEHFGYDNVAEISGRKKVLRGGQYVTRVPEGVQAKKVNQHETQQFQSGRKRLAIISGAGATGISLHADKTAANQQRRVFYAFELSWSADQQMQVFGRVHRSFQANAPIIRLVTLDLAGQKRLVNAIARRLAALGALTKGERASLGGDLFRPEDLTDDYGQQALDRTYTEILQGQHVERGVTADTLDRMGLLNADKTDLGKREWRTSVEKKFLNRIMALPYEEQNAIFDIFYQNYLSNVETAKAAGAFDFGVEEIKARNLRHASPPELVYTHKDSGAKTQLHQLSGEVPVHKLSFDEAVRAYAKEGFYRNKRSGYIYAVRKHASRHQFVLTGIRQAVHAVEPHELGEKYEQIEVDQARTEWQAAVKTIPDQETKTYHILTGAIFPIYDKIMGADGLRNVKVHRARLANGESLVGLGIQPGDIPRLKQRLGIGAALSKATSQELADLILAGSVVELDNGWRMQRARISGDTVIELNMGMRGADYSELRGYGFQEEVLNYKRRWFVMPDEAAVVLERLIKHHKAIRDVTSGTPQVEPETPDDSGGMGMPAGIAAPPGPGGGGVGVQAPAGSAAVRWAEDLRPLTERGGAFRRRWSDRMSKIDAHTAAVRRATRDGKKSAEAESIYRIIEDVARRFNLGPPGVGRRRTIARWASGLYTPHRHGLWLAKGSYAATFFHELGHHLHTVLFPRATRPATGQPTKKPSAYEFPPQWLPELQALGRALYGNRKPRWGGYTSEGWAEAVRYLVINPKHLKAQASLLYRELVSALMIDQPDVWKLLENARVRLYNVLTTNQADPVDPFVAHDSDRPFRFGDLWDDFRIAWFDRTHRAVTFQRDLDLAHLPADRDPHILALRANGLISGEFALVINRLARILQPIKNDLRRFQNYLVARRTLEKRAQGYDVLPEDPRLPRSLTNPRLHTWIADTEKTHPTYAHVAKELQDFNRWLIGTYAVQHHLITPEAARAILRKNLEYITFRMKKQDTAQLPTRTRRAAYTGHGSGIRRFQQGRGEQLLPPLESYLSHVHGIITRAQLNRVALAFTEHQVPGIERWLRRIDRPMDATHVAVEALGREYLKQLGLGLRKQGNTLALVLPPYLQDLTPDQVNGLIAGLAGMHGAVFWKPGRRTDASNREVTVMVNGQPRFYEVRDARLYALMEGLHNPNIAHMAIRLLGIPGRIFRAGVTKLNPSFFMPNLMRDILQALVMTESDLAKLPTQVATRMRAIRTAFLGGDIYELFLASGADMSGLFGEYYNPATQRLDINTIFQPLRPFDFVRGETTPEKIVDFLKLGSVSRLNAAFELITRLTEFELVRAGRTDPASLMEAGQAAADITLDFQRGGYWAKQINDVVPFFNAALLGTDKMARHYAKEFSTLRGAVRAIGRIMAFLIAPSAAVIVLNYDDPEYWALPWQQRDRHWFFPAGRTDAGRRRWVRVPKPYGLGVFSVAFERSVAIGLGINPETGEHGGDPQAFRKVWLALLDELRPSFNLAGVLPTIEVMSGEQGYSLYFDRPIVSSSDAKLLPEEQGATTSSATARFLGKFLGYPPAKIDYLIRGWAGGVGEDFTQLLVDPIVGQLDPSTTKGGRSVDYADWPIIRRFIAYEPRSTHEAIRRFYDDYQELEAYHASAARRDPAEFGVFAERHADKLALWETYSRAGRAISERFRLLRQVYALDMDPDEKSRRIDELYEQIVSLCRLALAEQPRNK